MNLRYRKQYLSGRYYINRKNIPYYDYSIYRLPEGNKGKTLFGLYYSLMGNLLNISYGIKIKRILCS